MLNDITDQARRRYLDRSAKGWPLPAMGVRREAAESQNVVAIRRRKAGAA
jgi:hypothetical protein